MDYTFRNAMFGGFNRQDVLTYLEATAKQAAQKELQLQQQLEQCQHAKDQLEADLSRQQEQAATRAAENEDLRQQLEQATTALSTSQTQCSDDDAQLTQLRHALAQAQAQIETLTPDATAYAAVKERTAGIELQAHQRAQAIQIQSQEQAAQLRQQMERWLLQVEGEYESLRTQVESTVSHAADKLVRAGTCLEQVSTLLSQQDVALDALTKRYMDAHLVPPDTVPPA